MLLFDNLIYNYLKIEIEIYINYFFNNNGK